MIYDLLAPFYDAVNSDIDYHSWADFIEKIILKEYRPGKPELILDLGCGTGRMTLELASRGYDMTGVDSSVEMLNIARDVSDRKKYGKNILWLCQNMCDFELYGTVEVAVSCLDCINHLTTNKAVQKCFDLVHNYLSPDGLFIFDINGKNKFENFYSNNSYVFEEQGSFCTWQNYYNGKNHVCDFYITVFVENEYGLYERFDDVQKEKMYTLDTIKRLLSASGFEFIGAYKDFDFNPASDKDDRLYIAARCVK